ncbi:MAG: mechanosensitive ion channel [Gammaproteobacteria bacterium]|nr:mechanosensitive ion channel [Gammaproteobacteria bacterium]
MNDSASIIEGLTSVFQNIGEQALLYLPKIAAAVMLLVVGWLLARLVRLLVVRAIGSLDHVWQRLVSRRGLEHMQSRQPPTRIVGELVFWLLMLVFVTLATEVLGLDVFGTWLKQIVSYLPLVVAGLLIVLVGFIVSALARDLVASAAGSAGLARGDLLARTAQMIILFIAIILGIDQIGIDIMFLSVVAGIILAAMLGGIALAFGLGARTHVSNIIAANQLRQIYQIGDKVRIGDTEGRVISITVSRVILETAEGSVDVPAKIFDEQVTVLLEKGALK